jgi:hypothetical protein
MGSRRSNIFGYQMRSSTQSRNNKRAIKQVGKRELVDKEEESIMVDEVIEVDVGEAEEAGEEEEGEALRGAIGMMDGRRIMVQITRGLALKIKIPVCIHA